MSSFLYALVLLGGMVGYYVWQQKKLKDAGGVAGVLAAADKATFGLGEGESLAKRWDAMFYMGPLVPESMPSLGQNVANFLTNTYVRGRQIRIGLTSTNRVVFSFEPDQEDKPGQLAAMRDASSAYSQGFRPGVVYTAANPPRIVSGESLFAGQEAWAKTVQDAPAANLDPQNYAAASRKMTVARLDNGPSGRQWFVWIDPEAAQFLSSWGVG